MRPVRDLALIGFLVALLALGFKRPFLFTLAYIYVDAVSPHRLSYYLLNSLPLSMIVAVLAFGGWLLFDQQKSLRITARQLLMGLLLVWCFYTTLHAAVPVEAALKWDWVWKSVVFAIFLPFTLRTKLRVEAAILFLVLSAATIIITGGIKTVLAGGGYGQLALLVDSNSGLYESSTIAAIAIALIPLIVWLARYGTIFPPDWRTKAFAYALVFACLLIPVGTEARTGLVCIGVLAVLMLRDVKRRALYVGAAVFAALVVTPFLPESFHQRMGLIKGYQADSSATTRIAVWSWTLDYAAQRPTGGGFGAYRINRLQVEAVQVQETGELRRVSTERFIDEGRAWHSAYFEMLGEQGYFGLALYLLIHIIFLVRLEIVRRRYRTATGPDAWIAPLATALQHFQIVFLVGAAFIAIAFESFMLLMLGVAIGFDLLLRRREEAARGPNSWAAPADAPDGAPARAGALPA
jgi:probable O-glycosylation ligase (exosortase A-associated)